MCFPVCADDAGSVNGENHRQLLQADVFQQLVIGSLKEGGINSHQRPHAAFGKSRSEGHRVRLSNSDIKTAAGTGFMKRFQPGCGLHGRRYGDDIPVLPSQLCQRVPHHPGPAQLR